MFHWTRLKIWYTADGLHFRLKRVGVNLVFLTCMPCASGELLPCVQLVWPALSCTGSNSTVITDSAVPYSQLGNHQSCCGCVDFHQLVLQTAFRCKRFPLCSHLGADAADQSLLPILLGAGLGDISARRNACLPWDCCSDWRGLWRSASF